MNFKKPALNFSGKNLTEFPTQIFSVPRLYKLNLSNNDIKVIPREIDKLKYLETLDLSGNKIRNLYAKLFELSNLKILILNYNQIVTIPKQIEKLQNIKILQLAHNKLSNLPVEISKLSNLEELNLTENCLDDLPLDAPDPFPRLKSLWIAHNPLQKLNSNKMLTSLKSLKSFYCYSPKIDKLVTSNDSFINRASQNKGNYLPYLKDIKNIEFAVPQTLPNQHNTTKRSRIFISYAHKDKEYLDRLNIHLKVLGRNIKFDVWEDTKIRSSEKWRDLIEAELNEASDAILLISTDFLASDFINENELPPLLELAKNKGTRIHPVIIRPCHFLKTKSLSQFQSVNSPSEALSECTDSKQERIWMKLCNDIQYFLEA